MPSPIEAYDPWFNHLPKRYKSWLVGRSTDEKSWLTTLEAKEAIKSHIEDKSIQAFKDGYKAGVRNASMIKQLDESAIQRMVLEARIESNNRFIEEFNKELNRTIKYSSNDYYISPNVQWVRDVALRAILNNPMKEDATNG